MKPNFKDRPDKALIQPELGQWTKWADRIEAELREDLAKLELAIKELHKPSVKRTIFLKQAKKIKEILGE